ncbi:MAG: hypothetical protein ABIS36_19015 [Chryseolinea sp.]
MFSTDVTKNEDGTYTVMDSKVDGDKNIYVRDSEGNRTGEVIGETLTEHTFINDDGSAASGAQIDLADNSGAEFLNEVSGENGPGLLSTW